MSAFRFKHAAIVTACGDDADINKVNVKSNIYTNSAN